MIVRMMCISCQKTVKVCGMPDEVKQETGTALLDKVQAENNGTFVITMFRCPFCGELHTIQIDTKETNDILQRSRSLMSKQMQYELDLKELKQEQRDGENNQKEIASTKKKIKRIRKKGIENDKRLELKRAELAALANGLIFKREDGLKDIVFKLYKINVEEGEIN